MISKMNISHIAIHEATAEPEILKCFSVIKELRPHLTEERFLQQTLRQLSQGYHLMYLNHDRQVGCILGYRIHERLAWGKILYIDDLGTLAAVRGKGYAGKLLDWAISHAKSHHCHQVHLDSGYTRENAHRLYLNHGFKLSSHHFSRDI